MRASKFTYAKKAFIIKKGEEGMGILDICRKAEKTIPQLADMN